MASLFTLFLELFGLSILPMVLFAERSRVSLFIPILWVAGLISFWVWRRYRKIDGDLWGFKSLSAQELKHIAYRFIAVVVLVSLATWWFYPEVLFSLIKRDIRLWLLIMVLYPMLSVLPQELIYRGLLYERYRALFRSPLAWILMSALSFALAHVFLRNLIAPSMCFVGGLFLAHTYHRTRSISLVVIEHALYGNFVFTLGLGQYFYHGRVT